MTQPRRTGSMDPLLIPMAAGLGGAGLYVAMLMLGPVIGSVPWFLSPVPLMAMGLALGWRACVIACVVGTVTLGLATVSSGAAALYVVSDVLPALVVGALGLRPAPRLARPDPTRPMHWYPPGHILAWLALIPPAIMVGAALLAPDHVDGLRGLLREGIADALAGLRAEGDGAGAGAGGLALLDASTREVVVRNAADVLPGGLALSWLFRAAVTAVLAQVVLRRMGRAVRPREDGSALDLPTWYGGVFAGTILLALLVGGDVGYVAGSAAVGLSLPFMLLGFRLVHAVARRTPYPMAVLVVFYVVFLSVSALAIVAMVLAGLVEFATAARRRAVGRASEEE